VSDEVKHIEPEDSDITEEWVRLTDEPDVRGVGAIHTEGGWVVDIFAQEFHQQGPQGVELRQRVREALLAVEGVTDVYEDDTEGWGVAGAPSGRALTRAVATVVDDLADRLRAGE
jgi:hypothetical protein